MTTGHDNDRRQQEGGTRPGAEVLKEGATWIYGGLLGLLAFIGLLLASNARDAVFEWTGIALTVFAVLMILGLVHRNTGRPPDRH